MVAILAVPILASLVLQRALFAGLTPPPSDYGRGSMFDAIAVRYDMVNRVLAVGMDIGWRQQMVDRIAAHIIATSSSESATDAVPVVPQILDVATGTADVALLLARAIPHANITGVDPSRQMLHLGRQKVARQQQLEQDDGTSASTITLHHLPAQDLTTLFPDDSFDAATMAFGIRNIADTDDTNNRAMALCQMHRVLRVGARLCILEFSEPVVGEGVEANHDSNRKPNAVAAAARVALSLVARTFIRYGVPLVGGILSGQPREYWHLQKSIQDFPSPPEFIALLQGLQCERLSKNNVDVRLSGEDPKDDTAATTGGGGAFRLEELVQLNFGSVQLYVFTKVDGGR